MKKKWNTGRKGKHPNDCRMQGDAYEMHQEEYSYLPL